jgi:putative ABC transport system substrate-binding protein
MLGAMTASVPLAARAQERVRRVGVLMQAAAKEPEAQARLAAFLQGLRELGWEPDRTIRIDVKWSVDNAARLRQDGAALVGLNPEVILAGIGATVPALLQSTRTIPIVFAQAIDPVGNDYVNSMSRPGGNATGFIQFEYNIAGKWMELLKEIAPGIKHVAVLREPGNAAIGQWAIIQAVAQTIGIEVQPINVAAVSELESAIATFAAIPNGGLITIVSAASLMHRDLILSLAMRHRIPAVYAFRTFVANGGLMSYDADVVGQYRRAAGYVDRILKGEKASALPVQAPTRYDLSINLKTAKALRLSVTPSLLARADQVIE